MQGDGHFDGFEGNAQSFRIVSRLSVHRLRNESFGLDLTAATLNAILKYPWMHKMDVPGHQKFGAYKTDQDAFEYTRKLTPRLGRGQCLEAQIMDHADAIAYAVHDMIDFYKAGLLPLEDVFKEKGVEIFISGMTERGRVDKLTQDTGRQLDDCRESITVMAGKYLTIQQAYGGTREEQYQMKEISSALIERYIMAPQIAWKGKTPRLEIPPKHLEEIAFLKELIWHYIINRPQLGTQQEGMRHIIRELFSIYDTTIKEKSGDRRIIPAFFIPEFEEIAGRSGKKFMLRRTRLAIDIVAGFSDNQAINRE